MSKPRYYSVGAIDLTVDGGLFFAYRLHLTKSQWESFKAIRAAFRISTCSSQNVKEAEDALVTLLRQLGVSPNTSAPRFIVARFIHAYKVAKGQAQ